MTKKIAWLASRQEEIYPSLPLHDPEKGWIPAEYADGTRSKIDLTTLMKDLHLISDVNLGHTTATVALYRIMLAILYHPNNPLLDFDRLGVEKPGKWDRFKLDIIKENKGLDPEWVNSYFREFEDRFYLLHPSTPFLQDASLFKTLKGVDPDADVEAARKALTKVSYRPANSIRSLHPMGVSPANGESDPTWGLPRENFLEASDPEDSIVLGLVQMLFYLRYSHPAVGASGRSYWGQNENEASQNDTYPAAHAFRCAVNYVVSFPTLFQTLVFATEYFDPDDTVADLPDWEKPFNSATGYLSGLGENRSFRDVASVTLPRSSVNMTHLGLALVPQFEADSGEMVVNGGLIHALRSPLFNFKHETSRVTKASKGGEGQKEEEVKKPSPTTWNPFVAVRTDEDKVLKSTNPISRETYIANDRIPRVLTAYQLKEISKPHPLVVSEQESIPKILKSVPLGMKIMIFSGDPAKQKDYADFIVRAKETGQLAHNKEMSERVDRWLDIGGLVAHAVSSNVLSAHGANASDRMKDEPRDQFWSAFSELFDSALRSDSIPHVAEFQDAILGIAESIYQEGTSGISTIKPMTVAQHRNYLVGRIKKDLS